MGWFQVDNDLYLIPLPQKIRGFEEFICAWLYWNERTSFIVDPGPLSSIDHLIQTLEGIGIRRLDYILLTHIHIDHAGGTGKLVESFPGVKVLCHPKAIPHLINPAQVREGSQAVLGDFARAYGWFVPVPAECIFFEEALPTGGDGIRVLRTPGHAPHHLSFLIRDVLFAGELAGVYHAVHDTFYARPATPPTFKLAAALESLEKAVSLEPRTICYGHYGNCPEALPILQVAQEQLVLWIDEVRECLVLGEGTKDELIERLWKKDGYFANYWLLEDDVQQRERFFIDNTIEGMKQYIQSNRHASI